MRSQVNLARLAVPLRITLALGSVPTTLFSVSVNAIASEKRWNALKNGIKVVRLKYRMLEKYCLYPLNRLKDSIFLWSDNLCSIYCGIAVFTKECLVILVHSPQILVHKK